LYLKSTVYTRLLWTLLRSKNRTLVYCLIKGLKE
jgi:hypothetical protein